MTALTPGRNMPATDLVYTPRPLALSIIQHFNPTGLVVDPARGDGAFYDQFPGEKDWFEVREGRNFLLDEVRRADWVMTNPPWSKLRNFIIRAMRTADNIVYLATITHFVTKARLRDLNQFGFGLREFYCVKTPPNPWPQNGFQLAAVHIKKDYKGPIEISGTYG